MKTVKDWHPSRYICVFLLGVVCALVGSVRAHEPETTSAIQEQTRAIRELTTAVKSLPRCPAK